MSNARDALLASPIAQWLGASVDDDGIFHLSFHEHHIGNPAIRAIHGGVVEAFLEFAAQCVLATASGADTVPQTVNADVDYLRSSRAEDMYGRARIIRLGRRVAFVEAQAWQQDEETPVAVARFRLRA